MNKVEITTKITYCEECLAVKGKRVKAINKWDECTYHARINQTNKKDEARANW